MAVLWVARFGIKVAFFGALYHPTYTRAQSAVNVRMALIFSMMITMLPIVATVLTELRYLTYYFIYLTKTFKSVPF